jgi:hypothetical protein
MASFCWLALEWLRAETETSAQHWRELSACCATVMPRMSFIWQYTLSTLLVEGVGKVSRSAVATTMFWLAQAKVGNGGPSW